MRSDAVGFFWNDAPIPKPPRPEKEKRQPPERTWERADYLPGIEEARQWPVLMFNEYALMSEIGGELIFDIECYQNYFQVGFMSLKTGRVMLFALTPTQPMDLQRLRWVCDNFTLVGFNSKNYDIPMLSFACDGHNNETLKQISDAIIVYEENPVDIMRSWKVKKLQADHIDLIEVAPLRASLKIYGGRIAVPKMQDLPFHPASYLTPDQMLITAFYNVNDMVSTAYLRTILKEQIELRNTLTLEHGMDLRSKSDAQIAEAVLGAAIHRRTGVRPQRPHIDIGTVYRYNVPAYMRFHTAAMQEVLQTVRNTMFIVDPSGSIGMPPELANLQIKIGRATYTMGIGGLHSTEKSVCHRAVGGFKMCDVDVESFYPRIILNQGLYPKHLGTAFLEEFNTIVERRLKAKHEGNKVVANSLKITINGSYGKLGSQWSILYAPDLLVQVTISGQLSLLMLIEMLEMYGMEVISANTDGIAIKYREEQEELMRTVVKQWEAITSFKTEETQYLGIFSKDVNNYIAVKADGKTKGKGLYANPWNDTKDLSDRLKKNPASQIAIEAVEALLAKQVPVEETIRRCTDFTKFITVRHVTGGAVKDGNYLGKAVRWYYATGTQGELISAKSGHTVPLSEGAKPCMTLPAVMPDDIDYDWYVQRAERHLKDIGYYG